MIYRCVALAIMIGVAAFPLTGCVGISQTGGWGANAQWPDRAGLKRAAVQAATDPHTWAPLAGAALLSIGNADTSASAWFARERPFFGGNADDVSDILADISTAAYFVTAFAAQSETAGDKARGLAVGVSALALNKGITGGFKSLVGRERPNGRDERSFPSGHASGASAGATLAVANLEHLPMPEWLQTGLTFGLYGIAGATGLARVEAGEHHLTDVLAGYGLGHFVAAFMQQAFMEAGTNTVSVSFVQADKGGVLVFSVPLSVPK